jgi:hypothetical protein
MKSLFEKQKKERELKSPLSDQIVSKVYLFSDREMELEMKDADKKHFGYMRTNLVSVKGEDKPFTRSLVLNKYQHNMFAKDNFKSIAQGDERIVIIQQDLSKSLEKSNRLSTSSIRDMSKETNLSLN